MAETASIPLSYAFASQHKVIADITDEHAKIYYVPPLEPHVFLEMQRILGKELILENQSETEFQQRLAKTYQASATAMDVASDMEEILDLEQFANNLPQSEDLLDAQDDAPIIRLINALFTEAIRQKASDIHIETYEQRVLVRNRVDGVLQEVLEIQRAIAPLVISRVKVMAKLDIAEKRIPQDGRISLRIGGHTIDVRVSTLPSTHGERIVLRILDKQSVNLNLSALGMFPETLVSIRKFIAEPHGIILVTGPTGSGKTTSLYAMLTELNEVSRNILTIEDPIEYDLPGIGQTQVNTKVDMTFAKGLRAILRQDPDVVMIGEIRDLETAEIAVQASLTGHLVLSTLHTNTALGAINRLYDMGVESFLLSSSLIGLIAQRLVRRLCPACKIAHTPSDFEQSLIGSLYSAGKEIYEPKGCPACNQTGYRGRVGIYEIIPVDEVLQSMIHKQASHTEMDEHVRKSHPSIRQNGFSRVVAGDTSIAEVLRVTSSI